MVKKKEKKREKKKIKSKIKREIKKNKNKKEAGSRLASNCLLINEVETAPQTYTAIMVVSPIVRLSTNKSPWTAATGNRTGGCLRTTSSH